MMRVILLTILNIFVVGHCFAQKEIKGLVLDSKTGEPVASATVTLHPAGSVMMITYSMTSGDGEFTLTASNIPDTVDITVKSMTIETTTKRVERGTKFVEFSVNEKKLELDEVIVRAPKIRQLGDTINYDVFSFLDETDRSIGDVLKKLPGIKVLSSGQILYQDKAISKFYIEGLDLLKGKYGIATNNVDASKVATVQVLENHQPIKVLKDMEMPETAAINLRLKKSSLGAFFATAQLGYGVPSHLLSNELVGMRFSQKQQDMIVYKGDNAGRDISKELISFYDGESLSSQNFTSVIAPMSPSIRAQHYLFNDAHLASFNSLRALKNKNTITTNLNYLHDNQKSSSFSKRDIFISDDENIQIIEDMNAKLKKRELQGAITLEGNTDNYYLNNKLNFSSKWNEHESAIVSSQPIFQNQNQPSFSIQNDFDYMHRKDNKSFRVGSNISYITQNHSLGVTPLLFEEIIEDLSEKDTLIYQDVKFNHLKTNLYVSGGSLGKRLSFGYSTNIYSDHYSMQSGLFLQSTPDALQADSMRNKLRRDEIGVRVNGSLTFNISDNFKPVLSFPVSYIFINRNDYLHDKAKDGGHILVSPLLMIQYPITSNIHLLSNIRYSNSYGSINEDYSGYIMSNYRSLSRSEGVLGKSRNGYGVMHFSYKNPYTTLFSSLRFSYTNLWRSTLNDIKYVGILSSSKRIPYSNTSHLYGVGYSLGKSLYKLNSEIKLAADYNGSSSLSLNQGNISNVRFNSYSVSPSIKTDIGKLMIIKYDVQYTHNRSKMRDKNMPPVNNVAQNVSLSVIPVKKLILNVSFNHYYNNLIESGSRSAFFGNTGIKYKLKDIDLMLDWSNIFNTREFINYSYSDISSHYSVYHLRPSEVMLRVRFKIL